MGSTVWFCGERRDFPDRNGEAFLIEVAHAERVLSNGHAGGVLVLGDSALDALDPAAVARRCGARGMHLLAAPRRAAYATVARWAAAASIEVADAEGLAEAIPAAAERAALPLPDPRLWHPATAGSAMPPKGREGKGREGKGRRRATGAPRAAGAPPWSASERRQEEATGSPPVPFAAAADGDAGTAALHRAGPSTDTASGLLALVPQVDPPRVKAWARAAGMHRRRLHEFCMDTWGEPPGRILRRFRETRATLMEARCRPRRAVAMAAGYASLRSYVRRRR